VQRRVLPVHGRVLRCPRGPRERRVQGGTRRGVRDVSEEVRAERDKRRGAQDPRTNCQADSSSQTPGSCNTCGVTIGETIYCSKCNVEATYAPVNGQCADVTQGSDQTLCPAKDQGKCTQCGGNSLLYMGGCYQVGDGLPGHNLCALANDGVCTEAAPGYFLNPLKANDKDSVVSCSDTTGFTADSKTYKGVQYCETCDGSALKADASGTAKCTRCQEQKYLKVSGDTTQCVDSASACGTGYAAKEDSDSGNRCIKCDDADNGGIADCTQCTATASPARSGAPLVTCSQCNGKKVRPDKKGCINACPANSSDNNGVCECAEGYTPDETGCTQNTASQCTTPGCKTCTNPAKDNEVCKECNENKYLTPTAQCIDDCGKLGNYYGADDNKCKECTVANCAECSTDGSCKTCNSGFYLDNSACKACDSSCKSCSGATASDCTECPTGKALKYGSDGTRGTCGEGCTTGTGQGACKTCGLTVEGTAYCSACNVATEYPQNGVCTSRTIRAATCSDASVSGGVCTACTDGYFRMNGGCYETSRYPGKSVCTTVASSGGTCQTAADGYYLNSGTLVTCPEGCKTCSDASTCTDCADGYVKLSNAQTCTKCDASCLTCETSATNCKTCTSGYYLSGSACTSCETDSGSVKGVSGCASCAAPSGSTGPVLCYLVRNGAAGPLSSRPRGHVCTAARVTRIAGSLLGASHGGRVPRGSE
ncbi:Variant-specific surface protein, partial [Giardia duodenalis]